jgi:hypothetical protein
MQYNSSAVASSVVAVRSTLAKNSCSSKGTTQKRHSRQMSRGCCQQDMQ